MEIAGFKRALLYENTAGYTVRGISNDEKWIALVKPNTTNDSDIHVYNVASRQTKHITPHTGDVSNDPADFDPASKWLYYLTDESSEFAYVARYELATGAREPVKKAKWDVMYTYFSHNGKYRVTGVNEDARTRVRIYEQATGKEVPLPDLPGEGDIRAVDISKSEKLMAFYFSGDRSPSDLFVYDFAARRTRRLTKSLNPEIEPDDLIEARVVRYRSFDDLEVPALLLKPHQAGAGNKAPALVWVHGGPGGQTRKGYSAAMQFLANHGYVILGVNNRGSSDYGKTFYKADDRKHGREPLWDCVEAKKYLASLDYVDAKKIGILGGSYGGYMTLAALTLKPDEFAVGVDLFGISNWVRTLESMPPHWESFRKALYAEIGDPKTDRETLLAVSPLFHAPACH